VVVGGVGAVVVLVWQLAARMIKSFFAKYFKLIYIHGHTISWFYDDRNVRG